MPKVSTKIQKKRANLKATRQEQPVSGSSNNSQVDLFTIAIILIVGGFSVSFIGSALVQLLRK